MKKSLLLLMLLPLFAKSQKIAMIDRNLQNKIVYVNVLKMQHLENGYFVLTSNNIKNVIDTLQTYRSLIADGKDIPESRKSVIAGNTYFTAGGDKGNYSLVIDTKINKMGTYYTLASKDKTKKENLQSIDNFVAYLEEKK